MATGIVGAAATLLLHSLFFAAAMWGGAGTSRVPRLPDAVGAGANTGSDEGYASERRMTIRLMAEANDAPAPPTTALLMAEAIQTSLKLAVTGPDTLPLPPLAFDDNGAATEPSDAELMARTKLVGIYESQIRARIERAWSLPAGSSNDENFSCRVLIRQRRDGRVHGVEMPYDGCGNSTDVRQSLVEAIFRASPLPAPPHPGVFVESFSITLHSSAGHRH